MSEGLLFRGGTVFDGASAGPACLDLRIAGGQVVEIGDGLTPDGSVVVDAAGLWILPGFIDAHSHADGAVLTGETMEIRSRAGVTTEIVGQDGLGLSFGAGKARGVAADIIGPVLGRIPDAEFADTAEYLAHADRGAFARVATLVPHGSVRATVLGAEVREALPRELADMRDLVALGAEQGAVGLSTGLSYPPALASTTDEIVAIASVLPAGTPYVTHLRDYGAALDSAIEEAMEICARSAMSLHLSHLHVSGPGRAGRAGEYLARLGFDRLASWDTYPYTSGCTFLRALVPPSAQGTTLHALLTSLREPAASARLAAEIDRRGPGPTFAGDWDVIRLAGLEGTRLAAWESRTIAEVAGSEGSGNGGVVLDALIESAGQACVVVDHGHLDNILAIASADGHVVGSDGILGAGVPHPRASNAFFRFLAWAQNGTLDVTVSTMVARMTGRTARRFGLPVGTLRPGRPADVLLVDPERLQVGPDFGHFVPDAVISSFIAGEPIILDGRWQGRQLAGMALRKDMDGVRV